MQTAKVWMNGIIQTYLPRWRTAMIIVSARKDFNNPDVLSSSGHIFKEVDLDSDATIVDISSEQNFLNRLNDKKVLFLIHGYNNEQDEVNDAYAVIEKNVNLHMQGEYDLVIGYSWPGGDRGLEWWQSKSRANAVARRLRFLLEKMSGVTSSLDLMSHSLGARVTLKALKQSNLSSLIRHYYCTAAAVDNEVLEENEEFSDSLSKVEKLFVLHSCKDGVLSVIYRMAEWDNALGLFGPEDRAYILNKAKNVYVANCKKVVDSHGGYKRANSVYQYMSSSINGNIQRFKTL